MALTLTANITATTGLNDDEGPILVSGTVPPGLTPPFKFSIDDEILTLRRFEPVPRENSPATMIPDRHRWFCARGQDGSIAATHSAGASVFAVADAWTASTGLTPPDPIVTGGGGGGGGTLEATLALGNTTGEHAIVMPMGTLDGTAGNGIVQMSANGASGSTGAQWEVDPAGVGTGGDAYLSGGHGASGNGGSVYLDGGTSAGGDHGRVVIGHLSAPLPTSDPAVADALWSDGGTVVVSGAVAPKLGGWGFAIWEYDFAVDGGALGVIPLRLISGSAMPAHAIFSTATFDVLTALADGGAGTATVSVDVEATGDIIATNTITLSHFDLVGVTQMVDPGNRDLNGRLGPTGIFKTTAARTPTLTVADHALTAGKFRYGMMWMGSIP